MTAGRNTPRPRLPEAPREYSAEHMAQLIRALENFMDEQDQLGRGRFSELVITDILGNGGGKEAGYLYQEGGTLKIVRSDDILASSLAATARVGTVTVTTS